MTCEVRNAGEQALEVSIHDRIGKDNGRDGVTAESVARQLAEAGDVREIGVSINSVGGLADVGFAIHDMLKNHPANVTVRVAGLAASAASIIAMAGDSIEMPAEARMLIHNPTADVDGDEKAHLAAADFLRGVRDKGVTIYQGKSGQSAEKIEALMDAGKWLSANEARELGLCDRVIDEPATKAALDLTPFGTVPGSVAALTLPSGSEPLVPEGLAIVPEGWAPVVEGRAMVPEGRVSVAELRRWTDAFGAEQGLQWFREGKSFAACQTLQLRELRNTIEALKKEHAAELAKEQERTAEARQTLQALGRGEGSAVGMGDAEPSKSRPHGKGLAGLVRIAEE